MARLSAENSVEQLAALNTPDQKAPRKSSRFKEFFKGGHSRGSLSSDQNASPPGTSPPGAVENLRPGFEKVGLHPSERSPVSDMMESLPSEPSRVLDLEEWEKLKEEHQELGYLAKVQLYKEREELKRHDEGEGMQELESPLSNRPRSESLKAMKVLGIEGGSEEKKGADVAHATTAMNKDAGTAEQLAQDEQQDISKGRASYSLSEAFRKTFEVSTSSSSSTSSSTDSISAIADPTPSSHPPLRHSPPLDDIRASAHTQVLPIDSISNIGDELDGESIRANASVTLDPQVADAIKFHEYRFHRIRTKAWMEHEAFPATLLPPVKLLKLGPFELEPSTARALKDSLLPFTYMLLLFAKAIQGPSEFLLAFWKMIVLAVAYTGVLRLMCWQEDGSSDVLLAPAEDLAYKVKQCCKQMMETFVVALAHTTAVALRELDEEDED